MGTINIHLEFTKTALTVNGAAIDALITWIKTNVIDKLPADATLTYTITIIP